MMRGVGVAEQSPIDRSEVVDCKDKKKKRRSNRRSKHNSFVSASSSGCSEATNCLGIGGTSNFLMSNEQPLPKASNVAFVSLPKMLMNGQVEMQEVGTENQRTSQPSFGEQTFSKSCPEPCVSEAPMNSPLKKDVFLSNQIEYHAQRKVFTPHWSMEAVNEALERGIVFKALFRVNAHNRLEAYCKIDGVPTDILISGFPSQNRAVEGDIVAIQVDPLPLWTRMKGSTGGSNTPSVLGDSNLVPAVTESVRDSRKGKNKVDVDTEYINCRDGLSSPENGFHQENITLPDENGGPELLGAIGNGYANGAYHSVPNSSFASFSGEQNDVVISVENLCMISNSFPSKRPTGRVVAIIERSPRRKNVVGFLSVKHWLSGHKGCKKDTKKNKLPLSPSKREYIPLTPTDPKFPKMMVPVRTMPDYIMRRLEGGDATVEMELVAAKVADWGEEFDVPRAHIVHVFGRGGEVGPQIAAILFENSIRASEFSPETLGCLPCIPWTVPQEEFRSRRDIRNLCTFTIDPVTATDLDDALSVELISNGVFRVGVHIADVSYFVLPDTALDIEAEIRSTNVYLLQSKLPMLPSLLSEDLGSLNPGVDRLAFSIFWDINLAGEVLDRWIGRTIIQSCCKLSYEHAQDIIDGSLNLEGLQNNCPQLHGRFGWSEVIKSVQRLHEVSKILKEKRFNDGALSLESPKVVFLFDEDGMPRDSMVSGRRESNFLVEEFMLLANSTAAEVITRAYPSSALLRRHPEPNLRKLREFEAFCGKHGLELDASNSGQLHQSLERIRHELKNDSLLFDVLMSYATRPMQSAAYFCSGDLKETGSDWGHYALAVPLYTHFTSPLRRYPDILVHRMLAATLEAEVMYLQQKRTLQSNGMDMPSRCFTGVCFDKDAAESVEAQKALSDAAIKHAIPRTELLADVAAHCNDRKLASRHVKDATDKLYMWVLLRRKEVLLLHSTCCLISSLCLFISVFSILHVLVDWIYTSCSLTKLTF